MGRAVVLLSGGLDSATVLAMARASGLECYCLTVDYGQRHKVEVDAAREVASALGSVEHRFASASLGVFGGSALTDLIDVPKDSVGEGIPVTYVPARNTVFLGLALGYAEVVGATEIHIGVNSVDYSGYPDCRPEFIEAFERLATLATKSGTEGKPVRIVAPLMHLSKAQIISAGMAVGLDYGLTHSCYDPDQFGRACGHCDSCLIRAKAFAELGLDDPALRHLAP